MARKLRSQAHSKHLILYHIVFVPHYRRKVFANVKFVDELKQESTIWMWMNWETWLKNFYWGTRKIWTRGYFVSSVGNVSADQIEAYLEKQSQNDAGEEDEDD